MLGEWCISNSGGAAAAGGPGGSSGVMGGRFTKCLDSDRPRPGLLVYNGVEQYTCYTQSAPAPPSCPTH